MVFDGSVYRNDDERFMAEAIAEADAAAADGEVPVGAVIVRDGEIIIVRFGNSKSEKAISRVRTFT